MLATHIPARNPKARKAGASAGQDWMASAYQAALACVSGSACAQPGFANVPPPNPCAVKPAPLGFTGEAGVAPNTTDSIAVRVPFRNWTFVGIDLLPSLSESWEIVSITAELENVIAAGQGPVPASVFSTSVIEKYPLRAPAMSAGQEIVIVATNIGADPSQLRGTFRGVQW